MWVLYVSPDDYPGQLILRRGCAGPAGWMPDVFPAIKSPCTGKNLVAILELMVSSGLFQLRRDDRDEPTIFCSWI